MNSTREKILRTLLSKPKSTINELAETVGINGISIRHHLTSLEADDLVVSAEERHGVGRPRLIYSLTDKGIEKFPTGYLRLSRRMIKALTENMTSAEMAKLFGNIGSDIARVYLDEFDGKSTKERLRVLKKVMTKEGYIVEYKKNKDSYLLTSFSCPYNHIVDECPELCNIDYQLISKLLSTSVEIKTCILKGDDHCSYNIPIEKSEG